jgi:hypothetical protein
MVRFGRGYPMQHIWTAPVLSSGSSGSAVQFDAASDTDGSATAWSFSQTIGASANALAVAFYGGGNGNWSGGTPPTVTVKVGSTSVPQIGSTFTFASQYSMWMFGLLNPPTGSQTISISSTLSAMAAIQAASFKNATGFSTLATASGNSVDTSQTVSASSNQIVFQMFGSENGFNGFTNYSGTQLTAFSPSVLNYAAVAGYQVGGGTITANSNNSNPWGGIAVTIL